MGGATGGAGDSLILATDVSNVHYFPSDEAFPSSMFLFLLSQLLSQHFGANATSTKGILVILILILMLRFTRETKCPVKRSKSTIQMEK